MRFGCFYIPSFPAWAFERVDAASQAVPIIVVASGRVVAHSRRLKKNGITVGISAERAEELASGAVLTRLRDLPLEQAAWEEVLHELNAFTPFLEPAGSPLEAELRTSTSKGAWGGKTSNGRKEPDSLAPTDAFSTSGMSSAARVAYFKPFAIEDMRRLTEKLGAQAALAPHRSTALLAALRAAEGNVLSLKKKHVRAFLDRFDIARLAELGYPEEMLEQLELFGFDVLGAAATLAYRHLKAQFGEEGGRLYRLLHPAEEEAVSLYKPPPSIRRAYEFDLPCSEPGEVFPAMEFILRQAAAELKNLACQRVKVILHDRLRPTTTTSRVLPEPSADPRRLFNTARTLLEGMLRPEGRVQAIEVELASLRHVRSSQGGLFLQRPSPSLAVRAIHRRYPDAIRRGVTAPDAVFEEERSSFESFEDAGGRKP